MLNMFSPKSMVTCALIFLVGISCRIIPARGQDTPAIALKDDIEDLANVDFKTDIRVFVVMAALNAAGYDFETEGKEVSGVRAAVREKISQLPASTFTELRLQYQTTNLWAPETTHAAYTSLALLLGGPPDFEYQEQLVNAPHGIDVIRGFETLLNDFYVSAGLEQLWREVQPLYQQELRQYRPLVNRMIRETLDYFRIPARIYFDRNIVIIPDLLSYQDIVNARNVEDIYYIVVGPTDNPEGNYIKLQHEYLHFLLDPLVAEQAENLAKSEKFLEASRKQPLFPKDLWNNYELLVTESLIESILYRMHPDSEKSEEDRDLRKMQLIQRGMILCPYFERRLGFFEANTDKAVTLPLFLGNILSDIPEEEIRKDLEEVELIQKRIEQEEAEFEEQVRLRQIEREKQDLLDQAAALISSGDLDTAGDELNKLLDMDPGNGKAFFYLAQISSRQKNWRKAREFHLKVIDSRGLEPWIHAHSLIQVGRINAAEGLYQEARKNFDQVLSMEGDLRKSREEAEFLLSKLPE